MKQLNREAGISQKYDGTLDYGIDMYDHLPYKRDSDVCNGQAVALYSGHIIKYYLCKNEEEPAIINNHDDEIYEILEQTQRAEEERLQLLNEPDILSASGDQLTDAQLQALTEDNPLQGAADGLSEGPAIEKENLDDIEDW